MAYEDMKIVVEHEITGLQGEFEKNLTEIKRLIVSAKVNLGELFGKV